MRKLLKSLKNSKNRIRLVKNSFSEDLDLIKYNSHNLKEKLLLNSSKEEKNIPPMSEEEKREKYHDLINRNREDITIHTFNDNFPLISIIIKNNNGLSGLKRIFKNFEDNAQYSNCEIFLIDNEFNEDSMAFLDKLEFKSHTKIFTIVENCLLTSILNKTVQDAHGEYILFLSTNLEPAYGWLNNMVHSGLKNDNIGAVGAKLVNSHLNGSNPLKIYQFGIEFRDESDGTFGAYSMGEGRENFDETSNTENLRAAFSNEALLVRKERFLEVNGLDDSLTGLYQEIDLCLKLHNSGYENIYCQSALLFHHGKDDKNIDSNKKGRATFNDKWNQYLRLNVFLDKLYGNMLFTLKDLKFVFTVTECGENVSAGDYFTALELGEALKKNQWCVKFLSRSGSGYWYDVESDVDVLISLLDTYDARRVKSANKSLIKIAWPRNWFDRWVYNPGFSDYNIILVPSNKAKEYIEENAGKNSILFPIATNTHRFNENIQIRNEYLCDYCFTGSYWNDPRDIMEMLDPDEIPYSFKLYGKNWEKNSKFKKFYQGFVDYAKLPSVYASTKIVIDDANRATKDYGAVNSRVYDAIASGALVLTNGEMGSKEIFQGKLPVFKSKGELKKLIIHYLDNEDERTAKVKELQSIVLKKHTYSNRADNLKEILVNYIQDSN